MNTFLPTTDLHLFLPVATLSPNWAKLDRAKGLYDAQWFGFKQIFRKFISVYEYFRTAKSEATLRSLSDTIALNAFEDLT